MIGIFIVSRIRCFSFSLRSSDCRFRFRSRKISVICAIEESRNFWRTESGFCGV